MVISQMLDSMEYLQSWKLVIFGKRATMKRDDRYLSLPLRVALYSCFVEDDLLLMNTPLWILNDQVCPEHSYLPYIPNEILVRQNSDVIYDVVTSGLSSA